ncbi:MAG: DUF167 domain-containing protein [Spirochaetaceae bacterium]|jgi:uncharacterized protein (TIGR00251 family)|nr:DUF167 domain-containing protein [Spirochaetaceae bacterium]
MTHFFCITPDGLELNLKITPSSSKTCVQDVRDGRLRIKVAAAPEDGKANAELIAFLAKSLSIPKSAIKLKYGEKSRQKTLVIPADYAVVLKKLLTLENVHS